MLAIHHAPMSRSLRVLWLCEELGLPYEIRTIEMFSEAAAAHANVRVTAIRGLTVDAAREEGASVLVRGLPGILRCGLWQAWRRRPQVPTATLVTDIGKDLPEERSA